MGPEELYQENVGLVDAVARTRYRSMWNDPDLLQSGRLGLWSAATCWKGAEITKFRSYAYTSIRNEMEAYRKTVAAWEPPVEIRETDGAVEEGPRDDMMSAIRARYGPNSRERFVLTALANGVSKCAIAACLGVSAWKVRAIAKRAYDEISGP